MIVKLVISGVLAAGLGLTAVVAAPHNAPALSVGQSTSPGPPRAAGRSLPAGHPLRAGHSLAKGTVLRSPNGRWTAGVQQSGHLALAHDGTVVWRTRPTARNVSLTLRGGGDLVLHSGTRIIWTSNTSGSQAARLTISDNGLLALVSSGGTVWSQRLGNTCGSRRTAGKRVLIDLGDQFARLCNDDQQVLSSPITSGATARGDATPTGTWHVQAKLRDTTLYPAAGGAYPVRYWLPYDGAYGMHDASWQRFPFGSARYRTRGSHGCEHFPLAAIAWMFRWASIGTTVTVRP